tara:strand:+ start:438 stop:1040 length:603 start_codon:yes stop_codon:yes gene_type:complete
MAYEVTDTAYAVGSVDEVLSEESQNSFERIDVPAGTWNMQICDVIGKDFYDKTDRAGGTKEGDPLPNAIIKKLIPLEVLDEGKYVGQRTLISVYMPPQDPNNDTHKAKYNMGKMRMSMLAKACGLSTIDDLNDCSGKFVKVTLKDKGGFLNLVGAEPFGENMAKKIEGVKTITSSEEKPKGNVREVSKHMTIEEADDIPF